MRGRDFWVFTVKFPNGMKLPVWMCWVMVNAITLWIWYESRDGRVRWVETLLIECDFFIAWLSDLFGLSCLSVYDTLRGLYLWFYYHMKDEALRE